MELWNSNMEKIYLPIICQHCGQQVSVRGRIGGSGIEFDPCPNCEEQIPPHGLYPLDGSPEEVQDHEITVVIGYLTEGEIQEATLKLGPYSDIITAMQAMTNSACIIFAQGDPADIKITFLKTEISELPEREQVDLREYLSDLLENNQEGNDNEA